MIKNLRWKIPLIVVVIAVGMMILYPPSEKVLKRECEKSPCCEFLANITI